LKFQQENWVPTKDEAITVGIGVACVFLWAVLEIDAIHCALGYVGLVGIMHYTSIRMAEDR
jgi:ABC-type nitrate/sulfonate/bicarbonate transport system permease component